MKKKDIKLVFKGADKQSFQELLDDLRPKGEWIIVKSPLSNETIVKCNKCGDEFIGSDVEDYNYCPNCGRKMKGGTENV